MATHACICAPRQRKGPTQTSCSGPTQLAGSRRSTGPVVADHLVRFRSDVPAPTVEACLRLCALLPPWEGPPSRPSLFEALRLALGGDAPITVEGRGPAFVFGERVDPRVDADPVVIDQRSAQLLEGDFPYTCANLG